MGRIKVLTIECFSKVLSLAQWPTLARERVGRVSYLLRHINHAQIRHEAPGRSLLPFGFNGV